MDGVIEPEVINEIIANFVREIETEFTERWATWKLDFSHLELHEVVGALIARQVTLTKHLSQNPSLWNWDIAPLFLRPMTEIYLNLAWIFANPDERARAFVLHGLGQAKLRIEHQKSALEKASDANKERAAALIESLQRWIDSQQYGFLTDVNLGSWAEMNQRKMAEEVGEINFYNYCYTPYSAGVHSMWHHIGIYNLEQCMNPLHRYHKVPVIPEFGVDVQVLFLAGKYLQMAFDLFDNNTETKTKSPSAFQTLRQRLRELGDATNG